MLNSIYIDGFKNLKNLTIDLKSRLNVLVGPNGIGKSNILNATAFVSHFLEYGLENIRRTLGVRNISQLFYWELNSVPTSTEYHPIGNNQETPKNMHFILEGSSKVNRLDISEIRSSSKSNVKNIIDFVTKYKYECKIGLDKLNKHPLTFTFQKLNFNLIFDGNIEDNLEVIFSNGVCTIPKQIESKSQNSDLMSGDILAFFKYLEEFPKQLEFEPLLRLFSKNVNPTFDVVQEISFTRPFEIIPPSIRYDDLVLNKRDIASDGSGLYSTLANLKIFKPEKFYELVDDFNLISPNNLKIKIEENSYDDLYTRITIDRDGSPKNNIPIQLLSDGQLKWFSLVSAILLSEKNLLIDEPENFMDTTMQSEFSNYLRNKIENAQKCCIVTTHSETLVNTIKPVEILLVDSESDSGSVRVRRIGEIDRLKKNMYSSGFPLGWYYHTGSLELYCNDSKTSGKI